MTIAQALMATAELCGTELSEMAAEMLLQDLQAYPVQDILCALTRCRRELKGRLTLAEILSRINDGRPGADEAWAMLPWEEEQTAVITAEMQVAQGVAWQTYHSGDHTAARFAFRDAYNRLVAMARENREPPSWIITLGWDKAGREGPIREAMQKGRLTEAQARPYLGVGDPRAPLLPPGERRMSAVAEIVRQINRDWPKEALREPGRDDPRGRREPAAQHLDDRHNR